MELNENLDHTRRSVTLGHKEIVMEATENGSLARNLFLDPQLQGSVMVTAALREGHQLLRLIPDEERRIDDSISYRAVMLKNCSLRKTIHTHTHTLAVP